MKGESTAGEGMDDDNDFAPKNNNPMGHSAEFEAARFKLMQDTANAPRESWEDFKAREKAKQQVETDKMNLEEKWRQEHRDQLDKDRKRLLKRGTNHGYVCCARSQPSCTIFRLASPA
eukprot:COSAG01_NODE_1796_length_9212_cov_45.060573_14_plen_118_part_00